MGRLSAIFINSCNLRSAVLLLALWLALTPQPPKWLAETAGHLNRAVFRAALYVSDLPVPRSFTTVVHVSDIEYERWLSDLAGASGLQRLLQAIEQNADGGKPVVGLVLEHPLALIQTEAESILARVHEDRASSAALYEQTDELLRRRTFLFEQLQSPQVVLGVLGRVPGPPQPLLADLGQIAELPQWLQPWLQRTPPWMNALSGSPALQYFPVPLNDSAKEYLILQHDDQYLPTFWAQFLAATQRQSLEAAMLEPRVGPPMVWHRDSALAFSNASINLGTDAGFVPIYGEMSGIRASLRQVSLEAALAGGEFGDWVLIGRDGDERLDRVAQVLASLGDRAMLAEPWWWLAVQKALLLASAILLVLVVPRVSYRSGLALVVLLVGGAAVTQASGQAAAALWLPGGTLVCFALVALALLWLWRGQAALAQSRVARADAASLALAHRLTIEGHLDDAYHLASACRTSQQQLQQLYDVAEAYERIGRFVESVRALREIKRRRRRFLDVPQKLRRLRPLAESLSLPPPALSAGESKP